MNSGLHHDPAAPPTARALVVDDDPLIRESLRVWLERDGYATLEAADGISGLELLDEEVIDVLLLDLALPRVSGIEVLTAMRERHLDIPVVVVSGQGTIRKRSRPSNSERWTSSRSPRARATPSRSCDALSSGSPHGTVRPCPWRTPWSATGWSAPARRCSSFFHRFGSSLNAHPHYHLVVIDGVFSKATTASLSFPRPMT
jgi:CheY-like chemotaxis protein